MAAFTVTPLSLIETVWAFIAALAKSIASTSTVCFGLYIGSLDINCLYVLGSCLSETLWFNVVVLII